MERQAADILERHARLSRLAHGGRSAVCREARELMPIAASLALASLHQVDADPRDAFARAVELAADAGVPWPDLVEIFNRARQGR